MLAHRIIRLLLHEHVGRHLRTTTTVADRSGYTQAMAIVLAAILSWPCSAYPLIARCRARPACLRRARFPPPPLRRASSSSNKSPNARISSFMESVTTIPHPSAMTRKIGRRFVPGSLPNIKPCRLSGRFHSCPSPTRRLHGWLPFRLRRSSASAVSNADGTAFLDASPLATS